MRLREVEEEAWKLLTSNSFSVMAENKDRAGLQIQTGVALAILALAKAIDRWAQVAETEAHSSALPPEGKD